MFIEFCLPVFNEEKILKENVLNLLNYLKERNFSFAWQIVILNNGSTDNTEKICAELAGDKVKIVNILEPGKGRAIKSHGLKSKADVLAYMDIDLAVDLNNIPGLIQPLLENNYDLIIGSRLLPESKTERSALRSFSSKTYNFLSRIILGHKLSDLQCGFKAIKIKKIQRIIPYIKSNKWFFDTELIALADHFNFKIKEIPVVWQENRYAKRKSKINLINDSCKFFLNLIKLKLRLVGLRKS